MDTLYFLHGYGVSEEGAEAWFATMFKRFWQSGMNVRFCGVTWESDDELLIPKYYANVENAFVAAGRLSTALRGREGRKVVMAHSLGNMLVSSAIQDHEAPVDVYFMFNSAVPAEAYDTDAPTYDFSIEDVPEGLIHDDWDAYPPKSYAALWYRLIKNRGVEVYNYYSAGSGSESGDEVLELSPSTPSPITGMLDSLGRYAWQKQEVYKGRVAKTGGITMMNTKIMGWGFEEDRKGGLPEPEDVFTLPDETLRTNPLFLHNPPLILGADASVWIFNRSM